MGKRATGRKLSMQFLYQIQIRGEISEKSLDEFFEEDKYEADTVDWARDLAQSAWDVKEVSDRIIQKYAIDWDFDRINPVDKSILRVAFYELLQTDTPETIILNEAIELSKTFSTDESPKFINGILGQYLKDEGREKKETQDKDLGED